MTGYAHENRVTERTDSEAIGRSIVAVPALGGQAADARVDKMKRVAAKQESK